ncbi:DUF4097 family beta strand repeat-containing protein [Pseudonocardia broussonetiae]|uniref:DUF4097 family beta strand repeat protein n=1 Tax=Pseudonocardia broussonetiae TaxID=2736640 RepID=A0A6M6JDF3_9PSEU|nr:DUF4097 family beta strand repeat-containing protein [Pseudonocardia broussonetiae]QJY44852.1 DUF4097 family beta strand repeat protein [Pseudonocardia broussonetiae]
MPVFATPGPISATIELAAGDVQIVATDRTDTSVEVGPTDASDDSDVTAARQTRVEYADGVLTVRGPRGRALDFSRKSRSVHVLVELPTGSQVHATLSAADVRSTGVLAQCRLSASVGHFRLDRTGPLRLRTSGGHVSVEAVDGDAEVTTGSGRVRIGGVTGTAVVENSNGDTEIGTVDGDLRVRSANGDIGVDRAGARVEARTSNGSIRVGEAVRDAVSLQTASGDLEIGVADGTTAWLDLTTGHGRVVNELDDTGRAPDPSARTVEVRARTSFGDITVHRS